MKGGQQPELAALLKGNGCEFIESQPAAAYSEAGQVTEIGTHGRPGTRDASLRSA
ncbi:MAG TPA: hypothetical protein VFA09_10045 [Ktedonobacteraceae bacterium]|nr:hypothetical protein [Ktedonobacteraceae bacterium]